MGGNAIYFLFDHQRETQPNPNRTRPNPAPIPCARWVSRAREKGFLSRAGERSSRAREVVPRAGNIGLGWAGCGSVRFGRVGLGWGGVGSVGCGWAGLRCCIPIPISRARVGADPLRLWQSVVAINLYVTALRVPARRPGRAPFASSPSARWRGLVAPPGQPQRRANASWTREARPRTGRSGRSG